MGNNRKKYDTQKALIIKTLAENYGCSTTYVRDCINDKYRNENALAIKADFARLTNEISTLLNK